MYSSIRKTETNIHTGLIKLKIIQWRFLQTLSFSVSLSLIITAYPRKTQNCAAQDVEKVTDAFWLFRRT